MNSEFDTFSLPSAYSFSGVNVADLAASAAADQTLVTIVLDCSGSISSHWDAMCKIAESVVRACQKSPKADSLMLRFVVFNQKLREIHGFRQLNACPLAEYEAKAVGIAGGGTALFDACVNTIQATSAYAKQLATQDVGANGIVVIITDGDDQNSAETKINVGKSIKGALDNEDLESLVTILVGVNTKNGSVAAYLKAFKDEAGLSQYVDIDDATPQKLAKLADFVSKSVSAQSLALGSGGPSQALTI